MHGSDVLDVVDSPIPDPDQDPKAYWVFAHCVVADGLHKTQRAVDLERAIAQRAAQAEHDLLQTRKREMARKEYEDFLRWKSISFGRP